MKALPTGRAAEAGAMAVGCLVARRRLSSMAAVVALLACAGCSTFTDFQTVMRVPDGTPVRPETPYEFPAVHELPPQRENALLDPAEQERVERELVRMRDRQAGRNPSASPEGRKQRAQRKASDPDTDAGAADEP
jgi:hypothetical protein